MINVTITTTSGRKYVLPVNPSDTVEKLKKTLGNKEHIKPELMGFSTSSGEIPEGRTLVAHGIGNTTVITVQKRVLGG